MSRQKQHPLQKRKPSRWKAEERDYTRTAVPIFTPEERDAMHETRSSFNSFVVERFSNRGTLGFSPEDVVQECKDYFKRRHEDQNNNGHRRISPWLNSASSSLTKLKGELRTKQLASYSYRVKLRLTKKELETLDRINHARLEANAHDLVEIDGSKLLNKLYQLLESDNPADVVVAIAGLTGRRQSEVTHSLQLEAPRSDSRHRYPSFWATTTGFLKQRRGDRYAVSSRELPLLAPRPRLVGAMEQMRDQWPSTDHKQASALYGRKVSKAVKEQLGPLGVHKLHDLRKTFSRIAFEHFNERKASLPAFASFVLGHKRRVSKRILTYLSMRMTEVPTLCHVLERSGSGLCTENAEQVIDVGAPFIITPDSDSSDEEEKEEREKKKRERIVDRKLTLLKEKGSGHVTKRPVGDQSASISHKQREAWIMPRHIPPKTGRTRPAMAAGKERGGKQTAEEKAQELASLF